MLGAYRGRDLGACRGRDAGGLLTETRALDNNGAYAEPMSVCTLTREIETKCVQTESRV